MRARANGGEEPRYPDAAPGNDARSVAVRIYRPCVEHQPYVTFYYMLEVRGPLTDFLYPEWGNVRFAVRGSWEVEVPGLPATGPQQRALFGPTDRHSLVRTGGGMVVGFGMAPIGWHRLIGGDAGQAANQVMRLGAELGFSGAQLHEAVIDRAGQGDAAVVALLEDIVANRLAATSPPTPEVRAVDRALRLRPATVEAFAAAAGLTDRTLHRVCRRVFGFSPSGCSGASGSWMRWARRAARSGCRSTRYSARPITTNRTSIAISGISWRCRRASISPRRAR